MSADPKRARYLENVYPVELNKPSIFVGRPGFQKAGSQLGDTGKRTGQLVTQFTKLAGTEHTVAIVGGQGIYTFNWSTRAWSQVVTVANLTTASITLSETARIYAVTFNDKLIISDGTAVPFSWDGTSGAGGLTELTNAPVLYGQPTVHAAKLFGIKNADRSSFVWSEENDETTGYEASGFTNVWQLGQTDQDALYAIRGTNQGLYAFRRDSATLVSGAVNATFQTTTTHDGVSESHGTISPAGLVYHEKELFYPNARGRPFYVSGGVATGIWQDLQETIGAIDPSALDDAIGLYHPTTELVLLGMVQLGQSVPGLIFVYNPILKVPVAVWRGFTFQAMGVVRNSAGTPVLMHLSDDGYAYDHGAPLGTLWDDELNAATQAIRHTVEGPHLGVSARLSKRYHRASLLLRAEGDVSALTFSYETPYGPSEGMICDASGTTTRWDSFNWDEAPWSANSAEVRLGLGLDGQGRWIRPRVQHEVAGERFGFAACEIEWTPDTTAPDIP